MKVFWLNEDSVKGPWKCYAGDGPFTEDKPWLVLGHVERKGGRFLAVVDGVSKSYGTKMLAESEVFRAVRELAKTGKLEPEVLVLLGLDAPLDDLAYDLRRQAEESEAHAQSARLALSEVLAFGPDFAPGQLRDRAESRRAEATLLVEAADLVDDAVARRRLADADE